MDSKGKEGTEAHRFDLTREAINSAAGIILEIINKTVHFIHQSAKDFILRERKLVGASCFNGLDPNAYLSGVCLIYLNFEDFQKGPRGSKEGLNRRKKSNLSSSTPHVSGTPTLNIRTIPENLAKSKCFSN